MHIVSYRITLTGIYKSLGCPFEVRLLPCEKNARKAALRGLLTKEDELQEPKIGAGFRSQDHTKTEMITLR